MEEKTQTGKTLDPLCENGKVMSDLAAARIKIERIYSICLVLS